MPTGLRIFDVAVPVADDWRRVAELARRDRNVPLGGTDASVVALAESLETDLVITLDRRHFESIEPRHCRRLELLPEPG